MAFVNLPPNLQDMFYALSDRIMKLETGPNQAMYTAEAAQGSSAQATTEAAQAIAQAQAANALGVQALAEATIALQEANAAYALGAQSLQKSASTITNASNQITAINGNGITVYSGASASSGARVVLNSAGLAGFNSGGTATFSIDASTGAVSTNGAIFTSSTITGGSLNINGNAVINSSGFLTATGATINGTITSANATITGGSLTVGANFQVTSAGILTASGAIINGAITATSGTITGALSITGSLTGGTIQTSSGSSAVILNGGSNAIQFRTSGSVVGNIVPLSSFGVLTHYGATADPSGGTFPQMFVGSTNVSMSASASVSLGVSTVTGITATGNLDVSASATFGSATANPFLYLSSSGTLRSLYTYGVARTASTRTMIIDSSGNFGTTASTRRKKHDIESYKIDSNALLQLDVKKFKYNPDIDETQQIQHGFIAEEAQELGLDELIQYDSTGVPDYFAYEKLPIFLLQLVQEQDKRLKALEG